jgi:hypothetical protein
LRAQPRAHLPQVERARGHARRRLLRAQRPGNGEARP